MEDRVADIYVARKRGWAPNSVPAANAEAGSPGKTICALTKRILGCDGNTVEDDVLTILNVKPGKIVQEKLITGDYRTVPIEDVKGLIRIRSERGVINLNVRP